MPPNRAQRVASAAREQKLNNALAGLKNKTFVHVRQAARATGARRTTISRHLNEGQSKREVQHHHQKLSPDEEGTLVKWVQRLSSTSHSVHHSFLHELTEEIRKPRVADSTNPSSFRLGKIGHHIFSLIIPFFNPRLQNPLN